MITRSRKHWSHTGVIAFGTGVAASVALVACSSANTSAPTGSVPAQVIGAVTGSTVPVTGSPAAAGEAVTVQTRDGALGTYLTDASGQTLYMFASDTATASTCSGACATAWPPLTSKGKPVAGSGARADQLSTFTRSDGTTQVAYAGHPLYYFKRDTTPGQITGQGSNGFGAKWWVLAPSGQPITSAAPAPTGASGGSTDGNGGGGGYGY